MTISGNEARRNRTTPGAEANEAPLSVSPLTLPFEKGEILAQKYRVESLLGAGGIGFVVAATHVELGERLALKFLRSEFVTHSEAVRRFASEARHAARIRSEHVARVFDVGTLPDGAPFIVMEYLEGTDLHRLLLDEGPLSVERAVGYVLEACEALAAAHACYIVHRDIKPDNLFVAKQVHGADIVKVLDFGISKAELDATLHEPGVTDAKHTVGALGSPSYMAPEQIRSAADVDARADIWSLGCVLYELLTKQYAFDAPSLMQTCAQVLESQPVPLTRHRPDLPAELEAVVARCLEKDPARRYQDLGELALALAPFAPPRAQASIEKTLETVRNIRPYSADEGPPSSRVVRSRPANDRPPLDESAVRPLPLDTDAEWEAIASDRDPPSLRSPIPLVKRTDASSDGANGVAKAAEEQPTANGAIEAKGTAEDPARDELAESIAEEEDDEDEDEPTRVFLKPLLATSSTTAPHGAKPIDTTPSIIIQDFREAPPWLDTDDSNWSKRSLTPLFIGVALTVLGIVAIEWRQWRPAPEPPPRHAAPPPPPATTTVVENRPPPAPTAAEPVHEEPEAAPKEPPEAPAKVAARASRPRGAESARLRPANVPKIEAIAEEVELDSEDDQDVAAARDDPATAAPADAKSSEDAPPRTPAAFPAAAPADAKSSGDAPPRAPAAFPASAVASVVREHAAEVRACYARAANEHPDLRGEITLHAILDEQGAVTNSWASSIEDGARLSACIAETARRWRFPEPPGKSKTPITYTFVFE